MPGADALELGFYFAGGVTGITFSMWFHRRAKAWLSLQLERRRPRRPIDEHEEVGHCGGYCSRNTDTH
jgi:hypothetical protein